MGDEHRSPMLTSSGCGLTRWSYLVYGKVSGLTLFIHESTLVNRSDFIILKRMNDRSCRITDLIVRPRQ
jgi:hypothetical protein